MTPKAFKKLQDLWYAKLAADGFVDVEKSVAGEDMLRQFASNAYRQTSDIQQQSQEEYFSCMSSHLDDESLSDFDRDVLRMAVAGETRVMIARQLHRHPRTIRYHIRRMESLFGVRHWDRDDTTSAPKKPKRAIVVRRPKSE